MQLCSDTSSTAFQPHDLHLPNHTHLHLRSLLERIIPRFPTRLRPCLASKHICLLNIPQILLCVMVQDVGFLGCQQGSGSHETDYILHSLLSLRLDHLQFIHSLVSHDLSPVANACVDTFGGACTLRTLCLSSQFVRSLILLDLCIQPCPALLILSNFSHIFGV